jgi:diacylglycerol kinase (ATP)
MPAVEADSCIAIICNPVAGGGRAARQLPRLQRALARSRLDHRVLWTRCVGDATRLAMLARESGASALIVVGGDGTLNEVSQAYVDEHGQPAAAPPVALIGAGSGDDFARSGMGLGPDPMSRLVERLMHWRTRSVDVGLLTLRDRRGGDVRRTFVNVASVGISGTVDQLVARGSQYPGGKAAYALASFRALLSYRNVPIELRLDGHTSYQGPTYIAAIANGRFFGGGYQIAPNASIDDGFLDVICIADFSRRAALALGGKLRRGEHLREAQVHSWRAQTVEVLTEQPVLVDVDGETPGFSPLVAHIVPKAMPFLVD